MGILFQVAVIILTSLIGALVVRKSKRIFNKRKAVVVVGVLAIVLGLLAGNLPIESALYTFPSLETAIQQTNPTRLSKSRTIIEGKESAMFFYIG